MTLRGCLVVTNERELRARLRSLSFRRSSGPEASGPLLRLKDKDRSLARSSRSFVTTKHPRSVIARTADGKILLIVVDGRRKGIAEGINLPELTHFTRIMGCTDVLNLDGGGSSTLWDTYQGITNMPSGNRERNVANSIFIQ